MTWPIIRSNKQVLKSINVNNLDIPVLPYLSEKKFVSGKQLSGQLGLSRVAVWKQIQKLKRLGYHFSADARKGYRVISRPDILLPPEIHRNLNTKYIGKRIYYFPELKSTNMMAKQKILDRKDIAGEGTIIIAERQSAGKGRLGREWFSPYGGIWLSIILYPNLSPFCISRITLMTAVAVVKAIRGLYKIKVKIKWPNDILIKGKKVCGILTEMSAGLEKINWVIVGIGINVNIDISEAPKDIQKNIISLKEILGKDIPRVKIVQIFFEEFEKYYDIFKKKEFSLILNEWKLYNNTIGKKIKIDVGEKTIIGEAIDINESGAIILKKEDGKSTEIISGTVLS